MTAIRSNRLVAALVLIATLALGVLLGVALDRRVLRTRGGGPPFGRFGGPPTPEQAAAGRARMVDRMTKDLELTAAQRSAVDSIFRVQGAALDSIRQRTQPTVDSLRSATRQAIGAILTPAQRVKADSLRARMESRRRGRGPRGGGGPPP